jgi:catechol 2,3-dioxygenase-like lactoylglutathione lyase family enzyme
MRIEKIDRVVFGVKDLDAEMRFLSNLLDLRLDRLTPEPVVRGRKLAVAISTLGIELHEVPPSESEGFRRLHLKVTDVEEAKADMERKGIRIDNQIIIGGLRELLLNEHDCHGIRIGLIGYDVPHGSVIAAGR